MADSTVLVSVPGLGDGVQAMKAGIMEIGDIFVVNKADREDADRVVSELNMMLDMNYFMEEGWRAPVIKTIGTAGEGVPELVCKELEHKKNLEDSDGLPKKRKERVKGEIISIIKRDISKYIYNKFEADLSFKEVIEQIVARKNDPYSYAQKVVKLMCLEEFYRDNVGHKSGKSHPAA